MGISKKKHLTLQEFCEELEVGEALKWEKITEEVKIVMMASMDKDPMEAARAIVDKVKQYTELKFERCLL
ncbi:hypothetical protein Psfp_01420 [Pelotomaculum sp. FP]|uniref:hypothetical protein n=1 Tax=Pelotomaculum sp. FP TaxID=261474 RepID=UPI0010649BE0|nr:hypothetical protein [Pelotomaculum sp. FP]TEB16395.1 hypothetical protein Psfp_01420 [Pelotomaculum sp. FP]